MNRGSTNLRRATLAWLVLLASLLAAPSWGGPFKSESLSFSARGQSLWGPGPEQVKREGFDLEVIDERLPRRTWGGFVNPENPVWRGAYNGCRNKLIDPGDKVCRGVADVAAFPVGRYLGTYGARFGAEAHLRFGVQGEIVLEAGRVDVDYQTRATLNVPDAGVQGGGIVTIETFETPAGGEMTTDFASIEAGIDTYLDMAARIDLEAYVAGEGGKVDVVNFDTGNYVQEIFGATVDPGAGDISMRFFDETVWAFPEQGIARNLKYLKLFPWADVALWVPKLDTPSPSGSAIFDYADGRVENQLTPGERLKIDFGFVNPNNQDTDFAKWDLDVDVLSVKAGAPLGVEVSAPKNKATMEANILDADFGAFHGISQKVHFQPELEVELAFDGPIEIVEPLDQAGVRDFVVVTVGDPVRFVHPGGTVRVTPRYRLANTFTNDSDFYAAFVYTESFLQLKVKGEAIDKAAEYGVAIPRNVAVFESQIDLGKPVRVKSLYEQFELQGFDELAGEVLEISERSLPSGCGNGRLQKREQCDDGNQLGGDGCDAFCGIELGFICDPRSASCEPLCGDGYRLGAEQCDDGNILNGDGCNAWCERELDCALEDCSALELSEPLPGTRLTIRNGTGDEPRKARLQAVARAKALATPRPLSTGDPRCSREGGSGFDSRLTLLGESGALFEQVLPCEHWHLIGSASRPRGYKYKDPQQDVGPCSKVIVKDGVGIRASCRGDGMGFDLERDQPEGDVRLWLDTGATQTWCAEYDPDEGRDGRDGRRYLARNSAAPKSCE